MSMTRKRYSSLIELETFEERFNYLKLHGNIGVETFGCNRYLNQVFYSSQEWKNFKRKIIVRDYGKDLGIEECGEGAILVVHHIVPITVDDVIKRNLDKLLNPENTITVRDVTHKALHYGDMSLLYFSQKDRAPFDTCPWKV